MLRPPRVRLPIIPDPCTRGRRPRRLPPLRGELGFSLHHPQRCSLGQTGGRSGCGEPGVCVVEGGTETKKGTGADKSTET